ncbi:hypothetical protein DSM106972_084030 [Dulcicalothrix desertica PCC 7102]|uniref:histidine kinase n=1 Tax=Dulcicalothrix desertica PCC 7102 TaxID=232991 RepID=A0A3S1C5R0_9CYAN|nr:PAS domain-containing protein [Dulcicalothrix desertica]RUS97455.1 hypothetical protein DSM106972_084030 [Dulcicalothrix desertica PCC 7102]TWH62055.1 PAS domain S-box-containing protein [Dulcicalothrix desertica PCC 7102]
MRPILPGGKILVVDDNADMRDYLQRILSVHWSVEVANNGEQAVMSIINNPPDLVVTDMNMTGSDGLALLREIRANRNTIPVLMLTAQADEETAVNGLFESADDFIVEPFGARELITRVVAQLEVSRIRQYNRQAVLASEERYCQLYENLQKKEEQLAYAQRAAGIGLWSYDLKTNTGFVTSEWRHLMGYPEDDEAWSFAKFLMCVHRDDQKRIKATHWKAVNSELGLDTEFRINHPKKGLQWILSRAQYIPPTENNDAARLLGYIMNITERKQFEQVLRLSQERYNCLKMVTAAIVWTAAPDGRIIEDVPMWEAFTGQTPAEYKGYGWLNALHPDDRDPTLTLWIDALEIKHPIEVLFRLRLRDGTYQEMLAVGLPVFDVDGNVWEWVGTVTEIR